MLSNITSNGRYSLPCLAAILFIAVGIPLIHPGIHHHDHGQADVDHSPMQLPATPNEDEDHQCPICDFQATNSLTFNEPAPFTAADHPFEVDFQSVHLLFAGTSQIQAEPRAPPFFK